MQIIKLLCNTYYSKMVAMFQDDVLTCLNRFSFQFQTYHLAVVKEHHEI